MKTAALRPPVIVFLQDNQPSFPGQDITALNPRERDHLLADLAGALPGANQDLMN